MKLDTTLHLVTGILTAGLPDRPLLMLRIDYVDPARKAHTSPTYALTLESAAALAVQLQNLLASAPQWQAAKPPTKH